MLAAASAAVACGAGNPAWACQAPDALQVPDAFQVPDACQASLKTMIVPV
jgi:hypothetical protein